MASKEALAFGRVGEDGTVYVKTDDGERAIGSYPDATPEEALSYFARKYDELAATAGLLTQRLERTDVSAHDARDSLKTLKSQIGEANVVGDLAALEAQVTAIEAAIAERQSVETKARAQAKAEASGVRETLVGEAEGIAETEPEKMQWKAASARMRELFDEWKAQQRSGARLDKDVEHSLWQRFAAARNGFDKTRKAWFAQLDQEQDQARSTKEALVEQAETLAKSDDWGSTAGEFKRLMQQWRNAGRARRSADDELWARFKAAQDGFFAAKDEVVAAEEAEFTENLVVKEALLVEAEALLPIKNLEDAKRELRGIQDRWDEAGKVPRADMQRVEARLRKVEQSIRDEQDSKWTNSNPELNARASSFVTQLEKAVADAQADADKARAAGDKKALAKAEESLASSNMLLQAARSSLSN
ncbi:DUF349 domain-containing protein [Ornithinimicrobium sp. Arc0846-15]|nr:DUF349 domain-containing protein [Ornithinimicrobium laminariae]